MSRLLALFALLALFLAVMWAQQPIAGPTDRTELGALLDDGKFQEAAARIAALNDPEKQAANWGYFEEKILALVEARYEAEFYEKALGVLDTSLLLLRQAGRADSFSTAEIWTWKALTCRELELYSDALDAYQEAIRIYERHGYNGPAFAYCYKNAAQIYIRRLNYVQADKYLKAAIQSDSTGWLLASIYGQLANNAYWQDSFDLAMSYVEKGRMIATGGSELASIQSVGASVLIKRKQWAAAEILLRQAFEYYRVEPDEDENRIRCYTELAAIAAHTRRSGEAERLFKRAETEGLDYFRGKSREMAKLYTEWGDFLLDEGREADALHLYQKALIQAYPDFNDPDPAANPDPAEAPLELWAMVAPARKAALLLRRPGPEARLSAAACFDLAFAAGERLRRAYGADEAKLYFNRHNYDLRREAVRNLWALHQTDPGAGHLSRLFDLLEDSRANTLRDALQQQRALALSGIPDSLLLLEESLRREIAAVQSETAVPADSSAALRKQTALFRLERRYEDLFVFLKKNYPQFNDFERAGATASLAVIRAVLPDSAALLSWFDAGDRYYCLVLRSSGLSAYDVVRDTALDRRLSQFLALLADRQGQERDPGAYFLEAYFLKQRLLPDSLLAAARAWIILPDGRLAYLPFEALLTAPHRGAYGTAPYVLRSQTVQYAWSAALLAETAGHRPPGKKLLQVAPFAAAARDGLAPLPNSLREKPEGAAVDVLRGEQATAAAFLRGASRYDVLHLSTHAHAGRDALPGIEFHDRTVRLPEIYAQRLHASMVALSACETNAGAFAEGEGVLSLARAFAYAGARSLVASHWSVNDHSTANLFAVFYRRLKAGDYKSEALRQAKLALLAGAGPDARKTPYHWAAFTLSGADGPVRLSGGWPWWLWAGLLSFCAAAAIFYWRKKRRH